MAKKTKFLLTGALSPGSRLVPLVQLGLGAFQNAHKSLITLSERPRIGDSLDIDEAFREEAPNSNRWDYIFSVSDRGILLALEPHHANDSEISVVIAKKRRASSALLLHLEPRHRVHEWLWVSSGRTAFSRMEIASRRLAQAGIRYVGNSLRSLD